MTLDERADEIVKTARSLGMHDCGCAVLRKAVLEEMRAAVSDEIRSISNAVEERKE